MARRNMSWMLGLPAVIFIGVLFLAPVIQLLLSSIFERGSDGGIHLSFALYQVFFSDPHYRVVIARTLGISAATVVASFVLAFPVALHMRKLNPRWRSVLAIALLSPLLTSVVVRTLAWVMLLGPKGIMNNALIAMGLDPVSLIYNDAGVIIGLTHVFFGYMLLCLMTSILKLDERLLLAASNLGASPWRQAWHIILPLSTPGVVAGAVIVFTMSASAYVTPVLLGGTKTKVMATEIYDLAINYLEWREAAVVACVLFAGVWVIVALLSRLADARRIAPTGAR